MKKTTKNILITLGLVFVLGGSLAALYLTEPQDEVEEVVVETETEDTNLIYKETTVSQLSFTTPSDEYVIDVTTNDITYDFVLSDAPEYQLESADLSDFVEELVALYYEKSLGSVTNLADYGLTTDGTYVDIEYLDGSSASIVIGYNASETTGKYVLFEDEVYIVDINEIVFTAKEDLVEHTLWLTTSIYDSDGYDISYISTIELSGTNFDFDIAVEYTGGLMEYTMTSPVVAQGDASLSTNLYDSLYKITSDSVAAIHPTDEQLEEFGLVDPFAEITYTVNDDLDTEYTITVGEQTSGYRYVCVNNDYGIVYLIDSDTLATWAEIEEIEYRSTFILVLEIYTIEKITVEMGDYYTEIGIDATIPEDSTSYEYDCTRDGEYMDFDSVSDFYMDVITIGAFSLNESEPVGDSLLTLTYEFSDGSDPTVVEFFACEGETERYVCYIDGEYSATVKKASLDTFEPILVEFLEKEATVEE